MARAQESEGPALPQQTAQSMFLVETVAAVLQTWAVALRV